jgi:uncharacterized protein YjiS (DUF1127 family)
MCVTRNEENRHTDAMLTRRNAPIDRLALDAEARRLRVEAMAQTGRMIGRGIRNAIAWFRAKRASRRTHGEMMSLDDRTLSDIGVNRDQVSQLASGNWAPDRRSDWINSGLATQEPANTTGRSRRVA